MEDYEIPGGTVKAVARRLQHYMDVERREEGFDLSGSSNLKGQFCSGRGLGGTLHYNSLQDKHMHHFLKNPLVRKRLESIGVVHKEMLQEMDKMVKKTHRQKSALIPDSKSSQQRYYQKYENSRLLETTAKVLIQGHSFTGVASAETGTSESNEKESEGISRSDSYGFPQYSPGEHMIPRSSYGEQASSRLEGNGKLSEKDSVCGDSYGRVYTYSTPPPTPPPSLYMLPTNTHKSQKSNASHHTPSSNQESSITPSSESPFTPSQTSSIMPSRKNPIMPSRESPFMSSQEYPIVPSQDSSLIPSLESLTMASDTAKATPLQVSPQANIPLYYGISPDHPLTAPKLQQEGHIQPGAGHVGEGVFDPSMDMQANTFPEGQEVGDNAAPKRKFLVVVMKNACVSTMNAIDASTQTPVHAETQTDKSALYLLSEKQRKKYVQKKKSVSSKKLAKNRGGVSGLELQGAANSYSQTCKRDSSHATRKGTSMCRDTFMVDKSAKLSALDSNSNEESSSSMSSYSSRRLKPKGKDSSQTGSPLQDESVKLSDAVSCIQKGLSTSMLSDSTTRLQSKDDISILLNAETHTRDYADHKNEYKEFQEAKKSVVDTVPLFPLRLASPSQKGGEIAPIVEGRAMTQETLTGDTPLPSSSSIKSSQQPPPHVEKTLFTVTTAPIAAEGTEVKNIPLEHLLLPPLTCEPLDVISTSNTKVKETELENTSLPLPPSTLPIHKKVSSAMAPLVTNEDERLSRKEPPLSTTPGHSAEVEITKASATSLQGLTVNDITEVHIQKNIFADLIPPLSAQKCLTGVLDLKEEDMAIVPISNKKTLPLLSSPHRESIATVLVQSIVNIQTLGENNQGTLQQTLPSQQPPPQESQSKTSMEVGKDLASAPSTDQEEYQPFSPSLLWESTPIELEPSSRNELDKANVPSSKDKESPPLPTTEMLGRSGSV